MFKVTPDYSDFDASLAYIRPHLNQKKRVAPIPMKSECTLHPGCCAMVSYMN